MATLNYVEFKVDSLLAGAYAVNRNGGSNHEGPYHTHLVMVTADGQERIACGVKPDVSGCDEPAAEEVPTCPKCAARRERLIKQGKIVPKGSC